MTAQRERRFDQVQLLVNIGVNCSLEADKLDRAGSGEEAELARSKADAWLMIQQRYRAILN